MSNLYKRDLVRIEVPILSSILDCKSIFLSEKGRQGITMPHFVVLLSCIRFLFFFINEEEIRPSNRSNSYTTPIMKLSNFVYKNNIYENL